MTRFAWTEAAARLIAEQLDRHGIGGPSAGLRLARHERLSALQMTVVPQPAAGDLVLQEAGVNVFLDGYGQQRTDRHVLDAGGPGFVLLAVDELRRRDDATARALLRHLQQRRARPAR